MDWPDLIPAVGLSLLLFLVPGGVPLAVLGLRPLPLLSLAPATSLAVVVLSAIPPSLADRSWGPGAILVGTCVAAGAALVLRLATSQRRRSHPFAPEGSSARTIRASLLALVQYATGAAIMAIVMATQLMKTFVSPLTIAQQKDNEFHLNAVAHAVFTRQAAPWDIGEVSGSPYYPPGFHDMAAALVLSYPGDLPLAAAFHAVMLVVVLVVWPLGMALLVETVLRPGIVVRMLTGPLCFSFMAYPLVVLDWGLIYPNILGFAVTPVLIALVLELLRRRDAEQVPGQFCAALLLAAVVGAAFAHPNSAASAALLAIPLFIAALRAAARVRPVPRWWVAFLVVSVVGIVAGWIALAPSLSAAPWSSVQTPSQALGETLTGTSVEKPAIWTGSLLLLTGLVAVVVTRRHLWLLGMLAVAGVVYSATSAWDDGFWRDLVGGMLYRDQFRAGSLLTYAWVPIAAYGLQVLARETGAWWKRRARPPARLGTRPARVVAAVVAALILSMLTAASPGFNKRLVEIHTSYLATEDSALLSPSEFRVLDEVEQTVPQGSTIIVDPWDGSSLAYAFTERPVTSRYTTEPLTPAEQYIVTHIDEVATDPAVCRLLDEIGADHVLSFGDVELYGGDQLGTFDELENLYGTEGLEPVAHHGDAFLYEITACD